MKAIQGKIIRTVNRYIKKNYLEYEAFCESMRDIRLVQKNEMASTEDPNAYMKQLAYQVPATLYNLIESNLSAEEFQYFKSIPGTVWFAKTFPEFSPASKI